MSDVDGLSPEVQAVMKKHDDVQQAFKIQVKECKRRIGKWNTPDPVTWALLDVIQATSLLQRACDDNLSEHARLVAHQVNVNAVGVHNIDAVQDAREDIINRYAAERYKAIAVLKAAADDDEREEDPFSDRR